MTRLKSCMLPGISKSRTELIPFYDDKPKDAGSLARWKKCGMGSPECGIEIRTASPSFFVSFEAL
jgi:hypothetical protein